ncbi:MAG: sulfate ABC transporter substrate-binding protein [Planctomycetales bacterium]|nr:sulfate ABC transporter substrate-binding protein [Planctomycetales bacterium]
MRILRPTSYLALLLFLVGCGSTASTGGPAVTPTSSAGSPDSSAKPAIKLLNVSYDPTREFYAEFNKSFAEYWKEKNNQEVTIEQSHGGSGKQARAVIDGLEADVVTLALAYDVNVIARKGKLLDEGWQKEFPHNSAPYTSTMVFLVRKGNPKGIKDWKDLVKEGVEVISPNPKTSGGARWIYLAVWGYSLKQELGDLKKLSDPKEAKAVEAAQAKAKAFVAEVYKHIPVLDSGARGSTNTFVQREIGDVLVGWENEAFLAVNELGKDKFEVIVPSSSILAEPPVAIVDKVADKRGTAEVAKAYLEYLYSPQGQQLAAKHYFRPAELSSISEEQRKSFAQLDLFTIEEVFGGWDKAQKEHFDDGGVFDQIYQPSK